jgi:hypothetical protein
MNQNDDEKLKTIKRKKNIKSKLMNAKYLYDKIESVGFNLGLAMEIDELMSIDDPLEILKKSAPYHSLKLISEKLLDDQKEIIHLAGGLKYDFIRLLIDLLDIQRPRIIEYFNKAKVIGYEQKIKENQLKEDIRNKSSKKFHCLAVLKEIVCILRAITKYSIKCCRKIHEFDGLRVLFGYINDNAICQKYIQLGSDDAIKESKLFIYLDKSMRGIVGCVTNLTKVYHSNKQAWKDCGAVSSLLAYADKLKNFSDNRTTAYIALANVADEEEIKNLSDLSLVVENITHMISICCEAIKLQDDSNRMKVLLYEDSKTTYKVIRIVAHETVWNLIELIKALYHMAINDNIKNDIYYKYKMNDYIRTIVYEGNSVEEEYAFNLLWQLCYKSEIANDVLNDQNLYLTIKAYSNVSLEEKRKSIFNELLSSNDAEQEFKIEKQIQANCKGILWIIEKKQKQERDQLINNDDSPHSPQVNLQAKPIEAKEKPRHIMISYNRESRTLCLKIKQELEKLSFKVWIDIEGTCCILIFSFFC